VLQTVVIDAHGHMLGRLASIAAKQLLTGQQLVSLTALEVLYFHNLYFTIFTWSSL
jgi:hypothetical protein